VWDISRCLLLFSLEGHKDAVFAVDMDDNDSLILTGSADRVNIMSLLSITLHLVASSTTHFLVFAF